MKWTVKIQSEQGEPSRQFTVEAGGWHQALNAAAFLAGPVLPPWQPANNGSSRYRWFLYRGDDVPLEDRYYRVDGRMRRYASYENAKTAADKLNAQEAQQ